MASPARKVLFYSLCCQRLHFLYSAHGAECASLFWASHCAEKIKLSSSLLRQVYIFVSSLGTPRAPKMLTNSARQVRPSGFGTGRRPGLLLRVEIPAPAGGGRRGRGLVRAPLPLLDGAVDAAKLCPAEFFGANGDPFFLSLYAARLYHTRALGAEEKTRENKTSSIPSLGATNVGLDPLFSFLGEGGEDAWGKRIPPPWIRVATTLQIFCCKTLYLAADVRGHARTRIKEN